MANRTVPPPSTPSRARKAKRRTFSLFNKSITSLHGPRDMQQ
jgi:hypothetical protein